MKTYKNKKLKKKNTKKKRYIKKVNNKNIKKYKKGGVNTTPQGKTLVKHFLNKTKKRKKNN